METDMRVLISGASIAGLTTAYWLARYGFRPTVVERVGTLRTGGNGVDLRNHAIEIAERMGIMDQVRAASADVVGMKFVNAADRTVARIDTSGDGGVEIMRGELTALLHQAAGDDVEYLLGNSITALEQAGDGVDVTFEHGPSRRFGLVVGADGLHSNVRRIAFGPESQFLDYKGHYFAFAGADATLGEDRWMTMYSVPGKMAGLYRSGNHAEAKAYFVFRSEEPLHYDHRDVAQHKRLISDAFSADPSWHITELLAAALADPEFYFDALSQVQMDSWSTGRVVLVGDAAYCASPASGSGAELAMVGAYRLAGELAKSGGDHEAAFGRYQEGHLTLVREKQQIGLNVNLIVPRNRASRWLRDITLRLPLVRAMTALDRLTSGARDVEPLPSYPAVLPAAS